MHKVRTPDPCHTKLKDVHCSSISSQWGIAIFIKILFFSINSYYHMLCNMMMKLNIEWN